MLHFTGEQPMNSLLLENLPPHLRQSRPVEVLERTLARGRLAHGILLHGDSLQALDLVALALAKTLLGSNLDPQQHPDFFTLRPAKKGRQIRVSGDNGKLEPNTMRWLLKDLQQTPTMGERKVAIVYEADRMNTTVANTFLKTLEEPPAGTTILLLTTRPYDLLATIRSRCLNFRLPTEGGSDKDAGWASWLESYRTWIDAALGPYDSKGAVADVVVGVYGLVCRFGEVLESITKSQWATEKARLPDTLDDDELDAAETGVRKGIRNQLWRDIELTTRTHLGTALSSKNASAISVVLAQVIAELERAVGLLEVNLNDDAALESFLLASMRLWARAG